MPDGPSQTEVPSTNNNYVIPEFTNPNKVDLKIIDLGYVVTPPKGLKTEEALINPVVNFLQGPLVTDQCTSHRIQRNEWEDEQSETTQQWLKSNRIGLNSITRVILAFNTFLWITKNGAETNILINPDTKIEAESLINTVDLIKNKLLKLKMHCKMVDGKRELLDCDQISDQQYHDETKERSVKRRAEIEVEKQTGLKTIKLQQQEWYEYTQVDDPSRGYDSLSIQQKLELTHRVTSLAISFLQQNGFTVEKRLFQPLDSG